MKFSIITVNYNGAETLKKTLVSVLNQTFKDFEYIIIDGGSTDDSNNLIRLYLNLFERQHIDVKYISEEDNGIYDAMNKGIKLASGDYIGILNSDDRYLTSSLSKINDHILRFPGSKIVHGNLIIEGENGKIIKPSKSINILRRIPTLHPATFIHKNVYNLIGLYDLKYNFSSDYEFLNRAYTRGFNFSYIDFPITVFSPYGVTSKKILKPATEDHFIRVKYGQKKIVSYLILLNSLIKRFIKLSLSKKRF